MLVPPEYSGMPGCHCVTVHATVRHSVYLQCVALLWILQSDLQLIVLALQFPFRQMLFDDGQVQKVH